MQYNLVIDDIWVYFRIEQSHRGLHVLFHNLPTTVVSTFLPLLWKGESGRYLPTASSIRPSFRPLLVSFVHISRPPPPRVPTPPGPRSLPVPLLLPFALFFALLLLRSAPSFFLSLFLFLSVAHHISHLIFLPWRTCPYSALFFKGPPYSRPLTLMSEVYYCHVVAHGEVESDNFPQLDVFCSRVGGV